MHHRILEAKKNYILNMTSKFADSHAAPKSYWALLNCLLYNKKITTIPPLLVNGKFFLISMIKQTFLITFFASVCTPIKNASTLPSFNISEKDILSIIKSLDPTKAHGCDNLSIKMIQICNEVITITLKLIFDQTLKKGKFPEIWKVANVVPVHKKEDKSLVKNYCPISLLPIFTKVFERVIYNSLFNYFLYNKLFTPSQSSFLPGDSCIAQLLSIIHEIQSAIDCY